MEKIDYTDGGIIKRWKDQLKGKKEDRENPMYGGPGLESLKGQIREFELKNEKLSLLEGIMAKMIKEGTLEITKPNEVLVKCREEKRKNSETKRELEKKEAEVKYQNIRFNFVDDLEDKLD